MMNRYHRGEANKRRKREIPSTSSAESGATMCSDNETSDRQRNKKPQAPPPSRASKRFPTDEERLAEVRHAPTANLAVTILEVADSMEQIAATAGNLKGTYVRRLRDDARKARASATKLAKRTTAVGAQVALEQENLQLRARLEKANQEIEELRGRKHHSGKDEDGKGSHTSEPTESRRQQTPEIIHPKPPKQVGMTTRAKQRIGQMEEQGEYQNIKKEMQYLTEQVKALRELVFQCMKGEKPRKPCASRTID